MFLALDDIFLPDCLSVLWSGFHKEETEMKTKILLTAFVLAAAPGIALAQCSWGKSESSASCAAGSAWDSDSQRCIVSTTS